MTETTPTASTPAKSTMAEGFGVGFDKAVNPPPETAAAASGGTDVISDLTEKAKAGAKVVEEKSKGVWDSIKGIWNDATKEDGLGRILGGLLGLGGAWFLGNFFGEGIFSTILMVCLAFPLMAIGSDKLGGLFNSWMGKDKAGQELAQSPDVSKPRGVGAQGQEAEQNVAGTGKPLAITELTEAELNAMLKSHPTDIVTLVRKADDRIVVEPGNTGGGGQVEVQALRDLMNSGPVRPGEQAGIDFVVYDGVAKVGADFASLPLSQNSQGRAR